MGWGAVISKPEELEEEFEGGHHSSKTMGAVNAMNSSKVMTGDGTLGVVAYFYTELKVLRNGNRTVTRSIPVAETVISTLK